MSFHEERCADFEQKFADIKEQIGNQPGCANVKLLRAKGEENVYFTLSDWESDSDLDNYKETVLFETVWAEVKEWFNAKPEAWSTEIIIDNKDK
jgi:(4S)-4-hydroxy-5-phosphonooxypentane-2,3-dione isomerase